MVRLRHEQRAVLIDTLPDTANVALGGLIFRPDARGRDLLDPNRCSWTRRLGGARRVESDPGPEEWLMTGLYIIFGGLVLFASFFGVMDLLAERRERHATERRWRS